MPRGNHKYIETPNKMWELFMAYRDEIKNNPIQLVEQKRGNTIIPKDAGLSKEDLKDLFEPIVHLPAQRPLTMEGFENYCADNDIINDLGDYFSNKNEQYTEFSTICSRIKRTIRQDQIEGGMVGIYNPSITQRLNNLVEKSELSGKNGENLVFEITMKKNESKD
jgi:hypothetical protein